MLSYCLICKKHTDNACTKKFMIKDGRLKIKSLHSVCGKKKVRYVNKWSSSLDGLMVNLNMNKENNDIINKFLLVGDKFMLEMHSYQPKIGKYSACGPFTKHKQ